jgi:hypothetical protein
MTTQKPYKLTKTNDPRLYSDWRLEHNGRTWTMFYDRSLKLWTAYELDVERDAQIGDAEYDTDKHSLAGSVTGTIWG